MDFRLKGEKKIQRLFKEGESAYVFPVRLVYVIDTEERSASEPLLQYGVAVSKKNCRSAVDRNRRKRQMREIIRKHIWNLTKSEEDKRMHLMFLYTHQHEVPFTNLEKSIVRVLQKMKRPAQEL